MVTFTPKTEEQIAKGNLWPEGDYSFEVLDQITLGANTYSTCDRTSKSGNEMIQLVLRVYNAEGEDRIIIDYLLAAREFKLRHAAAACGLLGKYETGQLVADDFLGKQGYLKLKTRKAEGEFGPKNEIKDYIVPGDDGSVNHVPPPGHPAGVSPQDDIIF